DPVWADHGGAARCQPSPPGSLNLYPATTGRLHLSSPHEDGTERHALTFLDATVDVAPARYVRRCGMPEALRGPGFDSGFSTNPFHPPESVHPRRSLRCSPAHRARISLAPCRNSNSASAAPTSSAAPALPFASASTRRLPSTDSTHARTL